MRRTREQCSYKKFIGLLIILVSHGFLFQLFSQNSIPDSVRIKIIPLSKINTTEAEYSPFKFKDKFYFVSDRENDFAVIYYDQNNSHQFSDLYRANIKDSLRLKRVVSISAKIKTKFYIGPSCETNDGFYCTVNNSEFIKTKKRLPLQINFLGKDEKNNLLKPTRISFGLNDTISCGQPSVWADTLMFFASDLYSTGKIDLFYSIKKNNEWQKPISCGSKVNTEYNELFPYFVNNILYFSSDRPNGFGGLDIYQVNIFDENPEVTLLSNPINSSSDDFGVYIDSTLTSGYFSTNRTGNDDIYYFNTIVPSFDNCKEVQSNNYCFTFFEETSSSVEDTTKTEYEWTFGDGGKQRGLEVKHCYPGEGKFLVELNVVEKVTGQVFFNEINYEFEIKNIVQIYIHAPDSARPNTDILFDPSYTNIDSLTIKKYYWDFGDGTFSNEEKPNHVYAAEGTYTVMLGLEGTRNGKKYKDCATKKIVISNKVEKPVFNFIPPINNPPIDFQKRIKDSIAKNEKEFYDFIVKKEKADSIANSKKIVTVEIKKESEDKVGIFPIIEKDDKYKNISNVYAFNQKDSTITYKVHIGVSEEKLESNDSAFKGLDQISSVLLDSLYHYFYGEAKTVKDIIPFYEKSKEVGFNASVISTFGKDVLMENPSLKYQYLMLKDTIQKGYVRPRNKKQPVVTTTTVTKGVEEKVTNVIEKNENPTIPKDNNIKTKTENNKSSVPEITGNRVEIGTFITQKTPEEFSKLGPVIEIKTEDGSYKYFTEDVKSPENAMDLKEVLVSMGYTTARVVGGKPIKRVKEPENEPSPAIAYRVQIGAYRVQKPKGTFDALGGTVKEIKTEDGYFKYVTEDVKTLENALDLQSALLSMGYSNAFVTAYNGKRRIPLIESILDGLCVYFNLDSYKVLPSEMEKIDFYFKKYTQRTIKEVELEGNTCNLGTAEYNFKLSERRVLAVEQALTPYVKVKINRKFLGEFYPLYPNSPESVRKLNRRVDVVILN